MEDDVTSTEGTPTPEQLTPAPAPAAIDAAEIKNLKSEMNRKMTNLEATTAQLLEQLQRMQKPVEQPTVNEDISKLWYDNPEKAAALIEERALKRFEAKQDKANIETGKKNAVLAELSSEFPELNDGSSPLTKKALEIYNTFSKDEQTSPASLRAAVTAAALETNMKPKRLRQDNSSDPDSFTMAGGKGKAGGSAPAPSTQDKQVAEAQSFLAEQFGITLTPEAKERLKNKHGRKNYSTWG